MNDSPNHHGRALAVGCLFALLLTGAGSLLGEANTQEKDERADAIAARTLEAMGGKEGWDKTRFIRFNFFGFRLHHWDRATGRHRLEGTSREDVDYVVLHNLDTREGAVYLDGKMVEGEKKKEWLDNAYSAWINDTYWLLMPYKLKDPGVTLSYDGSEVLDGVAYDRLLLTFERVGLTPGDKYWAWINKETGLMDRWAYFLESYEEGREPTQWKWLDWDRYGKIVLSPRRIKVEDGSERGLTDLAVFDEVPDRIFESPEPASLD